LQLSGCLFTRNIRWKEKGNEFDGICDLGLPFCYLIITVEIIKIVGAYDQGEMQLIKCVADIDTLTSMHFDCVMVMESIKARMYKRLINS
jgi:hypothetical protein